VLLDFARPRPAELDATDAAALEDHLFRCDTCAALAEAERRLDERLGQSMRQVEVPQGLKKMILERTEAAQSDQFRRRLKRWTRPLTAAAALLIAVGGVWAWSILHPPRPDLDEALRKANELAVAPPAREERMAEFKGTFGISTVFPEDFKYELLKEMAIGSFQGKKVPLLVFSRNGQVARVLILSDWDFDFSGLDDHGPFSPGYSEKLDFIKHSSGRYAYVIYYTGDDWRWLRTESPSL
jgi:hypothetical protein